MLACAAIEAAAIEAAAVFLPDTTVTVEEIAGRIGLKRAQVKALRRVYGVQRFRYDPGMPLLELLLPAAQDVLKTVSDLSTVRYLIYAHATQEVTPSTMDAAGVLRDSLGLLAAESFAITQQNCASGLAALDVAGALLAADDTPDARAIVITGEKPFSRMNHNYFMFGLVMGEAATATLVSRNGNGDTIKSYASSIHGELSAGIFMTPQDKEHNTAIGVDATVAVIEQALADAELTVDDIDLVIPHNPDMSDVAERLGVGPDRWFTENLAEYSHCYASDVLLNYVTVRDTGRLKPGHHYLLVSTGLGAVFSAMVVTHQGGR